MRPNFFVNTPDILHALPAVRRPGRRSRSAPRSRRTGSPSWGVYAGYELFEHVAVQPGSEEYLDSEKYQIRIRDWEAADAEGRTLAPYLTRLNEIRRAAPGAPAAAQRHRSTPATTTTCWSSPSRHALPDGADDVVVA